MKIVTAITKMESKPTKSAHSNRNVWEEVSDRVIAKCDFMRYIGVFTFDGALVAVSERHGTDRTNNQIGSDSVRKINVNIEPRQIKAIIAHISSSNAAMVQITIANLHFLCLRYSSGFMTGMSNFNIENSRRSIKAADEAVHLITGVHFTGIDAIEAHHLLQIGAVLDDDVLLVGLSIQSNNSCLAELKNLIKMKKETETSEVFLHSNYVRMDCEEASSRTAMNIRNDTHDGRYYNDESELRVKIPSNGMLHRQEEVGDMVEMRQKARHEVAAHELSTTETERPETKYEEDWHTATMGSIEALRSIGPFVDDSDSERTVSGATFGDYDRRSSDSGLLDENSHMKTRPDRRQSSEQRSSIGKLIRRPSRATMV